MVELSKKKWLIITLAALVIVGVVGLVGIGGNNSGSGNGNVPGGEANAIQDVTVEESNGGRLTVDVGESTTTTIGLLKGGRQIENKSITAAETVAYFDTAELSPGEYTIVAYNDGTVLSEQPWEPRVGVAIPNAERMSIRGKQATLKVTAENTGDIPVEITSTYISGGFPTEVHGSNRVAEKEVPFGEMKALGGTKNLTVYVEGYNQGTLTPPENQCAGQTLPLDLTIKFAEATTRVASMNVTFAGEMDTDRSLTEKVYCTNTTVDVNQVQRLQS